MLLYEHGIEMTVRISRTNQVLIINKVRAYKTRQEALDTMQKVLDADAVKGSVEQDRGLIGSEVSEVLFAEMEMLAFNAEIDLQDITPEMSAHMALEKRYGVNVDGIEFVQSARISTWVKRCDWLPIQQNWPDVNSRLETRREYVQGGLANRVMILVWLHVDESGKMKIADI